MFRKALLLITLVVGLIAGPAWVRGGCVMSVPAEACACCEFPAPESCCVGEPSPPRDLPVSTNTSGIEGFRVVWEAVELLVPGEWVERVPMLMPASPDAGCANEVSLERICIRLI